MTTFTHINSQGEANMVDVSAKAETVREAQAEAIVTMSKETLSMIVDGKHHKGDVFATARIAVTSSCSSYLLELIPLCHPLLLSKVEVNLEDRYLKQIEFAFEISLLQINWKNWRGNGSSSRCKRCRFNHLRYV